MATGPVTTTTMDDAVLQTQDLLAEVSASMAASRDAALASPVSNPGDVVGPMVDPNGSCWTPHEPGEPPAPDGDDVDLAARQGIRDAFVEVAKDEKGGVGSDKAERKVDQMLFDMLPKIDFSQAGGEQVAGEVSDFISGMGHKISKGEIAHLQGLLNEAAAQLPAGGAAQPPDVAVPAEPAPEPMPAPSAPAAPAPVATSGGDDATRALLALLTQLLEGNADGKLDPAERAELTKQLAALTEQLAGTDGAGGEPGGEASPPVTWTAGTPQDGKATINLGDKYELQLDESKSEMKIVNKETQETTRIWGDPHVDWNNDGTNDVDFKHTTTFELEDGTQVTIDTQRWKDTEAYISDKVTIRNGDNQVVVEGLGQATLGDLKVTQTQDGAKGTTPTGHVVKENADGIGWLDASDGKLVTQDDMNRADAQHGEPPASDQDLTKELLALVTTLAAGDGKLSKEERADLLKQLTSLTEKLEAGPSGGATPAAPQGEATPSKEASGTAASDTQHAHPSSGGDNSNEIMLGLIRLLVDMLGANEDGRIDDGERNGMLKDLADLMQRLLDDGTPIGDGKESQDASGGANDADDAAPVTKQRPDNAMHDSVWFFEQTGLSDFLSGYLGDGNKGILDLVTNTLRGADGFGAAAAPAPATDTTTTTSRQAAA